jgi:hypothetical protein
MARNFFRAVEIVAVDEGNIFALGGAHAKVPGGGKASVGFAQEVEVFVMGTKAMGDFGRVVRGAVVHDEDFKVVIGLGGERSQGRRQITRNIIGGDDHADFDGPRRMPCYSCFCHALFLPTV